MDLLHLEAGRRRRAAAPALREELGHVEELAAHAAARVVVALARDLVARGPAALGEARRDAGVDERVEHLVDRLLAQVRMLAQQAAVHVVGSRVSDAALVEQQAVDRDALARGAKATARELLARIHRGARRRAPGPVLVDSHCYEFFLTAIVT